MKCTLSLSLATVCNEISIFFHVYIESFNTRIRSSLHIGYTIRLMGEWGQQQVERSSFSTCWCVQEAAASRRRRHVHRTVCLWGLCGMYINMWTALYSHCRNYQRRWLVSSTPAARCKHEDWDSSSESHCGSAVHRFTHSTQHTHTIIQEWW